VIEQLEKGNIIWKCSWNETGFPTNVTTGVRYRGWNVFWLNFHTMIKGYPTPRYITFKQAQHLCGTVRKGEKGVRIAYWATVNSKQAETADVALTDLPETRSRMVPKIYTVFNIAQVDGITFPPAGIIARSGTEKIAACELIVEQMPNPPEINLHGQYPVYYPQRDTVAVPDISQFDSSEEYYCALFHELAHSTGHQSRLNRKEITESNRYGSEAYSREELTAEMTAAFLCAIADIEQQTLENSAAYLQGWLKALKDDKTLLLKAAGQAQKAADYLLQAQEEPVSRV
jgi:antirestriction protein ArdC